ncbi:hypothetical protein PINS_up019183 [Pythium insidiosum]|nr:hypothetical protein PINS_up012147 [Pythium insidiosum]GLE08177.1 hypothetical protein PINS_up019183 [Pythium insidiosum]
MRSEVLSLFRACMRSAQKCPEWQQREMMKAYVRMKFRDEKLTQDETRIRRMLADAREELAQMEYYHSVYEAKQRQSQSNVSQKSGEGFVHAECRSCGSAYSSATAKFCANCGVKRV